MNMLLEEWDWDEAKEAWREEVWEEAEAKYQPVIAEQARALTEKDLALTEQARENEELRRKLREAGIEDR
jgi:hypothetical protein